MSANKEKIVIHGGGDHARVVVDILQEIQQDVVGIFDPKHTGGQLYGVPLLGAYQPSSHPGALSIVAIGDNVIRQRVAAQSSHRFTNVIHPSALLSSKSTIGNGNMILHGAIIQASAKIGNHIIINTGARVDHDCIIGDYVHLAPGVTLCGTVRVGEGTFLGAASVVIPGITIGKWVTLGAGAVAISDIPDYAVAVGNPARIIKFIK